MSLDEANVRAVLLQLDPSKRAAQLTFLKALWPECPDYPDLLPQEHTREEGMAVEGKAEEQTSVSRLAFAVGSPISTFAQPMPLLSRPLSFRCKQAK